MQNPFQLQGQQAWYHDEEQNSGYFHTVGCPHVTAILVGKPTSNVIQVDFLKNLPLDEKLRILSQQ